MSKYPPRSIYERYVKRAIDFCCSGTALVVLSPVYLTTAILVRVNLGSPVIFKQERPGLHEKSFYLYKFRSMTDAKDKNGNLLSDEERLTKFGRKLRSSSLDELPELLNIVKGDMAIIGPRPLLTQYLPAYTEEERHRHDVRPGLSGLAQVNGRNFVPWDQRLAYDIEYVNKITFLGDVKIVIKTIKNVLAQDDVATNTEEIDEGYLDEIRGVRGRG